MAAQNIGFPGVTASRVVSHCAVSIFTDRDRINESYSGVISRFVAMALKQRPLTIFGDGLQRANFIYISDVVEAYSTPRACARKQQEETRTLQYRDGQEHQRSGTG